MIDDHFWDSMRFFNERNLTSQVFGWAESGPGEWILTPTTAPFNTLYFIESGSIFCELLDGDGQPESSFTLGAGSVYLLPCVNHYNLTTPTGFRKYYGHFNLLLDDGFDLFDGLRDVIRLPCDFPALNDAYRLSREDPFSSALTVKAMICQICASVLRQDGAALMRQRLRETASFPPELLEMIRFIRSSPDVRMTVSDLSRKSSLSESSVTRMFREYLGTTPKKYMSRILYDKAQSLLLESDMSIKEIALELRFSTQFAFTKFFVSNSGRTPSEMRAAFRRQLGF